MITWIWKPFDALSTLELYDILRVRQQVFVIEQTCIYLDLEDGILQIDMRWSANASAINSAIA